MKKCPLINKKCSGHECEFYTHLVGMNPQTGQPTDEWKCAITWIPLMLVENSNMIRHTSASVDKVANEVTKGNESFAVFVAAGLRQIENKKDQNQIESK